MPKKHTHTHTQIHTWIHTKNPRQKLLNYKCVRQGNELSTILEQRVTYMINSLMSKKADPHGLYKKRPHGKTGAPQYGGFTQAQKYL